MSCWALLLFSKLRLNLAKYNCGNAVPVFQKMYAVCDLALGLIFTKSSNFVLKDFPAEPVLPAKLFTQPNSVSKHGENDSDWKIK